MSCGPSDQLRQLATTIEAVLDTADTIATTLPLKIASIPGFVEAQLLTGLNEKVQLLKDIIEDPLAAVGGLIPSLPGGVQDFINSGKEALGPLGETLTGAAATAIFIDDMIDKYSGTEVTIDNIADLLTDLGDDIDLVCQLIPNIQNIGGELVVKGFPVSFPSIDPTLLIKEGKFPDITGNIKDALKNVDLDFEPNLENQGIKVSEAPGAPYRVNGRPRSERNISSFLDDLF
jgi:hypothetical protein